MFTVMFDLEEINIKGNSKLLYQAFYNILNNAIKYSPEFSMIQIKLFYDENKTYVSIIDEGFGMSPEQLSQIKDRFYKGDQSHNIHADSNGLGLSIVESIIQYHDADIDIKSEIDEGTEVVVSFKKP